MNLLVKQPAAAEHTRGLRLLAIVAVNDVTPIEEAIDRAVRRIVSDRLSIDRNVPKPLRKPIFDFEGANDAVRGEVVEAMRALEFTATVWFAKTGQSDFGSPEWLARLVSARVRRLLEKTGGRVTLYSDAGLSIENSHATPRSPLLMHDERYQLQLNALQKRVEIVAISSDSHLLVIPDYVGGMCAAVLDDARENKSDLGERRRFARQHLRDVGSKLDAVMDVSAGVMWAGSVFIDEHTSDM